MRNHSYNQSEERRLLDNQKQQFNKQRLNTQGLKLGGKVTEQAVVVEEDTNNAEFVGYSKQTVFTKLPVEERGKTFRIVNHS